ncbi:MAG TPA: hypothetical protein PLA41_02070 [Candidatus Pacearchaeota archaeon]|nr:hypothetical protein [Candidatus Parcubacteria bacterium]HNZ84008.1 hypothetical protein [Candidatus Pacearchaeota archaeon]HOU45914.1 hypothetical protein [Candidatus Pacearchaeota archaeon]HPM08207.1 hypothetical protein [Candidatus Pacearchaeota archaeon]HQI74473.1 hypothetical protein [Candidatus Pacearchaeota archaeon]
MDQYREIIGDQNQDSEIQNQELIKPEIPIEEKNNNLNNTILENRETLEKSIEKDKDYYETQIQELEKTDYAPRPENVEDLKTKSIEEVIEYFKDRDSGELRPMKLTDEEKADKRAMERIIDKIDAPEYEKQEVDMIVEDVKTEDFRKQAEKIIMIAEDKGFRKAMNALKKIEDPYVIDLVHDLLSVGGLWKRFRE